MYKNYIKRLIDIVLGVCALPFVLLVILVFGPLIYFSDRGRFFIMQSVLGKMEKHIKCLNFVQ